MIRRKNSQFTSPINPRQENSPIRFQRQNINMSPGLSPMRSRTPVKNNRNVSPIRLAQFQTNPRAPSPIKFVRNERINITSKRDQNILFQHNNNALVYRNRAETQQTRKRVESNFTQQDYSYSNNYATENVDRNGVNTKLFSNLVSKLNSDKKKQSSVHKADPKPLIPIKKMTSDTQKPRKQLFAGVKNIQSVQSVGYQDKTNRQAVKTTPADPKHTNTNIMQFKKKQSSKILHQEPQKQKNHTITPKEGKGKQTDGKKYFEEQTPEYRPVEDKADQYFEEDSNFECVRLCIEKLKENQNNPVKQSFYQETNSINFSFNMDPFI